MTLDVDKDGLQEWSFLVYKEHLENICASVKLKNMIQEMILKASLYNKIYPFSKNYHNIKDHRNYATKQLTTNSTKL